MAVQYDLEDLVLCSACCRLSEVCIGGLCVCVFKVGWGGGGGGGGGSSYIIVGEGVAGIMGKGGGQHYIF